MKTSIKICLAAGAIGLLGIFLYLNKDKLPGWGAAAGGNSNKEGDPKIVRGDGDSNGNPTSAPTPTPTSTPTPASTPAPAATPTPEPASTPTPPGVFKAESKKVNTKVFLSSGELLDNN